MFDAMSLAGWRQFGDVEIHFHPRLTVLTGANGSGKTTLLNVLGRHFNWIVHFVGVPFRDREGRIRYRSGLRTEGATRVGWIRYSSGEESPLQVGDEVSQQFEISIASQQFVPGLSIPSHRAVPAYQSVPSIPSAFNAAEQVLNQYRNDALQRYLGVATQHAPLYWMKESLLAAGAYAEATQFQPGNEEGLRVLLEALISCGVAMSIAGSSRPCSGSEHLFSHALDLVGEGRAMHGEQCGVGAILAAYLHGGNWRRIRSTLREFNAPTSAVGLGVEDANVVRALEMAASVRPERYTILHKLSLTHEACEKAAKNTGVIG